MDGYKDDSGNAHPILQHFTFATQGRKPVVIQPRELASLLLETPVASQAVVEDITSLLLPSSRKEYINQARGLCAQQNYQLLARIILRDNLHLSPEDAGRIGRFSWVGDPKDMADNIVIARLKKS